MHSHVRAFIQKRLSFRGRGETEQESAGTATFRAKAYHSQNARSVRLGQKKNMTVIAIRPVGTLSHLNPYRKEVFGASYASKRLPALASFTHASRI